MIQMDERYVPVINGMQASHCIIFLTAHVWVCVPLHCYNFIYGTFELNMRKESSPRGSTVSQSQRHQQRDEAKKHKINKWLLFIFEMQGDSDYDKNLLRPSLFCERPKEVTVLIDVNLWRCRLWLSLIHVGAIWSLVSFSWLHITRLCHLWYEW